MDAMVIVAKIFSGPDNYSFMHDEHRPYCCPKCGYPTKVEVNPNFKLKKRRMDVSYTYDGYFIVSSRFKSFCESTNLMNLVFHTLENESDFFFLESTKIMPLDHKRRSVEFVDLCTVCDRFAEVIGATPSYLSDCNFEIDENSFYQSEFGSYDYKSPLIISSVDIVIKLTNQRFKGLNFNNVSF